MNKPMNTPEDNTQIIFGTHAVHAALRHKSNSISMIYLNPARQRHLGPLLKRVQQRRIPITEVDDAHLNQLSDNGVHQGIVAQRTVSRDKYSFENLFTQLQSLKHPPLVLILDRVTDPGNLGACLRSACAFGVDGVILTRHHSSPLNAVVHKTACGAVESLNIAVVNSLSHVLQKLTELPNFFLYGSSVEQEGEVKEPHNFNFQQHGAAIVLGGEEGGVRQSAINKCDSLIHIALNENMPCLNVSAACAVLLYEVHRQRHVAMV